MPIHKEFRKGQRVQVMFKDRRPHVIGRFQESTSKRIVLDTGSYSFREVRAVVIYRASASQARSQKPER